MATRKKAKKAKSKVKRRKVGVKRQAKRPVVRKKKPVKVPKKAVKKPKLAKKPASPPPPPGERLGVVTHYFSHLSVAVVKLDPGTTLRVGDDIHIKGHTSDFGQRVESLQVGHAPVSEVGPDDDFGMKVAAHAREHDVVYKVR